MTMRICLILLAILSLAAAAHAFDEARARQILDEIASDSYEGRRPGHAGGTEAEEFLAENLKAIGVEPGGRGGYFQDVPMLVTEEQGSELTIMDHELGRIPFVLGVDFTAVTNSGSGGIVAPAVLAGYGYVRPDKGRDDYGDLDVAGKIVVIVRGKPDSPYDFEQDFPRRATLAWAAERGAAAVLYYQDPKPVNGAAIPESAYDARIPVLYVGDRFVSLILDGTGYSLETYKDALKSKPLPLETGKRVWVSTTVRKLTNRTPRNVLGIVYGTDPVLKNEIVVVGGHFDHIGKNSKGIIYNGADDNASGTAIVAEIARSLVANPLKRSVLIAHFTGEEDGLLGSDFFVKNPSIPFGNIVGMVNLDCEGLGSGHVVMAGGETFGAVWDDYLAEMDSVERSKIAFYREDGDGPSDHGSFMKAGTPVVAFWSRGQHPFYHSYEDDARWISDSVMALIGNRAEDFVRFAGNHDGQLAFHTDSLRLMARFMTTIDFAGFNVDVSAGCPNITSIAAAWLPKDAAFSAAECIRRISELRYACDARGFAAGSLKDAIQADRTQKHALFFGMDEADINSRSNAEIHTLARQGLSVVRLGAGTGAAAKNPTTPSLDAARAAGFFALIPFDFSASSRVARWAKHGIVRAGIADFARAPETVREGLLTSDAFLIIEVSDSPSADDLRTLYTGRERLVHLSFGSLPSHRREEHARTVLNTLYEAGYARDDILLLTGGNLRRFFQ